MDGPQGECDKHFTPVHLWGEGFFLSGRGIVGENFTLQCYLNLCNIKFHF